MHKYLYTVFQAIKDKPRVLRTLLEKQIVNKKGVYYVKICQDGVWRYIIIDELLPFMKDNTGVSPAFISISNGIIWPLLIEKALAKIYHTYQSLELGNSIETLRDLTGLFFKFINYIYNILRSTFF